MNKTRKFIIVDDDEINNFICREFIRITVKTPNDVLDFTSPEKGLAYITSEYQKHSGEQRTALFLDINMPTMSGWEFLEKFSQLNDEIKKMFSVFIMSSSINPRDREQADSNPYVAGFIIKPVSEDFLLKVCA
jgi:CheY-like chemotaxis protein